MIKYPQYNNQRAYNYAIQSKLIDKDTNYKLWWWKQFYVIERHQTGLTARVVRGVINRHKKTKNELELKLIFRKAIANQVSEIMNKNKPASRDPQKEPAKKPRQKLKVIDEKKGIVYEV